MSRLAIAAAAYRAAEAALAAHERDHGCSWKKDPSQSCSERDPLVKAWSNAQSALEAAALDYLPDALSLTCSITTTYTLAPWEPHEERTSVRWWRGGGGSTLAARTRVDVDRDDVWHWSASLPFGDNELGEAATEPEARDAADAALARFCGGAT